MVEWQRPPEMVEIEVPTPGPGEVLVRVAGNGLCHSDITMMEMPAEIGEHLNWSMPFTLGHESSGWIEAVGPDTVLEPSPITGRKLAVGAPVALMSTHSCGRCGYCTDLQDSLCVDGLSGRGYGRDGGLAEYVIARAGRDLVGIGGVDPVVAGTLTDAAATSYHAVSRVLPRIRPGGVVGVIGIGGLGSYVVQLLATLSDATIVAIDSDPGRLDRARELGAHETMVGVDRSTRSALRNFAVATGATDGCDAVIDVVGTDETIDAGLRAVRPGGAFALVGSAGGAFGRPWFSTLPREADVFTFQGSTIAHVHAVVALADEGRIRIDAERFAFDDVDTAYRRLGAGELTARAVITMG